MCNYEYNVEFKLSNNRYRGGSCIIIFDSIKDINNNHDLNEVKKSIKDSYATVGIIESDINIIEFTLKDSDVQSNNEIDNSDVVQLDIFNIFNHQGVV